MFQPIRFFFSNSKNFASTFKIRSRLGQFFKHVHPDQLNQASKTIRQQNLRSLTNLNAYIDAINQAKPIDSKLLKFYLAEKTNTKSKKFYSFSIELPQINMNSGQLSEQRAKKLIDNIVDVLNNKFKESKSMSNKKEKIILTHKDENVEEQPIDKPTSAERFNSLSSSIKPFDKKKASAVEEEQLKSALNSKYMEAEKDSLSAKLKKKINFADTSRNKPMMWSRMAAQESGLYKDMQHIFDSLIDPRLVYFDQKLSTEEIEEFKRRLLPGSLDQASYKKTKIILEVCSKLQNFSPPICIYVSDQYSGTQIPGFFTVPFDFQARELGQKYEELIEIVLEQQRKYQQYYDYYCELVELLKKNNGIVIDMSEFKNNQEIWMKILALKRLQRVDFREIFGQNMKVVLFEKGHFSILKESYKIKDTSSVIMLNNKVFVLVEFVEEDLQKFVQRERLKNDQPK